MNTKIISVFLILFGLVTLGKGGSVLFIDSQREAAGIVIPVILWGNFITGFFAVILGIGSLKGKTFVKNLSRVVAVFSFLLSGHLIAHIILSKPYEVKTLFAMSFRTILWISVAVYFTLTSKKIKKI